jgi:hypothetical protein
VNGVTGGLLIRLIELLLLITSARQLVRGDVRFTLEPREPTVCHGGDSERGVMKSGSSIMDIEGSGAGESMVDCGVRGDNEWPIGERGDAVNVVILGGDGFVVLCEADDGAT